VNILTGLIISILRTDLRRSKEDRAGDKENPKDEKILFTITNISLSY